MERESFENEEIARILNEHFISIKVDREERPDVDEVYMTAVQIMSGRGGWPMSVFLTPDRKPFFAGTYFPPEDKHGRMGFKSIIAYLADAYRTRREEVEATASRVVSVMKGPPVAGEAMSRAELNREPVANAIDGMKAAFDERRGGFGRAPKFPPHGSLALLFYEFRRTNDDSLLQMATRTLDAMARGGIRDHLGGGFHRYSIDAEWLLPHFEKMLYDNAQLARAYVDAYLLTKKEDYLRVALETYEWVLAEMTGPEGGFHTALDADSQGEEGRFYLWTMEEIIEVLGEEEGRLFCSAYGVEEGGDFNEEATGRKAGENVLHLSRSLQALAEGLDMNAEVLEARLDRSLEALMERREARVRPRADDKVLTGLNGLMIGSLAYGGRRLREERYVEAAEKAARFILQTMRKDGSLLRSYRQGTAKLDAYLDDYAFLADGLIELYAATRERTWLDEAAGLADVIVERFGDEGEGGFFFTSRDHEELLTRSKDPFDRAVPSANAAAARVLARLGLLTGDGRYSEAARASLVAFADEIQRSPRATESFILALAQYLDNAADARVIHGPVVAEAFLSTLRIPPGGATRLALRLTMMDGWHINSHSPRAEHLVPTSAGLEDSRAVLTDVTYQEGRLVKLDASPEPLSIFEGTAWIGATLQIQAGTSRGPVEVDLRVRLQPCSGTECSAPATVSLPLRIEVAKGFETEVIRHREVFSLDALSPRAHHPEESVQSRRNGTR